MSDKENTRKPTVNAERAVALAKEFTEEAKLAAEAMERTAIYRRTLIVEEPRYAYQKIF